VPTLGFAAIRRSLLVLLSRCPANEWLSVASLIEYLKKNVRYFLIPKNPKFKEKWRRTRERYDNFVENRGGYEAGEVILQTDPDAFQRVEGRYAEF